MAAPLLSLDVEMEIDDPATPSPNIQSAEKPKFAPLPPEQSGTRQYRKVAIPPHRISPLKKHWLEIYTPLIEYFKLQVRFNLATKCVELRTSPSTTNPAALQKAADFLKAFALGFQPSDAMALLRLDDLYIDTFEVKDVKTLGGDHLSRAIGRMAGHQGKIKFTIENASKTRIVIAETKIHILGSFQNIRIAKDAIVSLILGSPPGKVTAKVRSVCARMKERF
ncbi:pre-rRNA-processing protein pno1 [Coelomomyces lativittatus]|nr:pre-rRNA-processing protein pno1 [Coelomomyces lativittatus]